jgi:Flp pilus assembly secretin CpaC
VLRKFPFPRVILLTLAAALWAAAAFGQSPAPRNAASSAAGQAELKKAKKIHQQAQEADRAGDWQKAYELHAEAAALAPANAGYVLEREAARFRLVQQHVDRAEREALAGRMEQAREELREALKLDPSYTVAQERLEQFSRGLRASAEPRPLPDEGLIRVEPKPGKQTFSYRGISRGAYEEMGRRFGITVAVEDDVRRREVEFNVKDADFWAAIGLLAKLTMTQWRALDKHAILVFEDTVQKRRQLLPSVVRTVPLAGADTPERMTETMRVVREIAGITRTQLDTRSGTLTLRDSPQAVELAVELINQLEQARGEVMLEIDILEVDRATAQQLGISPPTTGRVVTISPQDIDEARQSTEALLRVIQRLFGTVPVPSISGQVRPEVLIPPLVAFGGGRTVFLATLPGAAADFAESLSLVRRGQRVLLRGVDGEPATFFVGERYPINLQVLSPGMVGTPVAPGVSTQNFQRLDFETGKGPVAVVAGDFNGDNQLDLAVANQSDNTVSILLGKKDGSFEDKTDFDTGDGPVFLGAGDFNGDGLLDLVVVNQNANSVSILLGNGDGTFAPRTDFVTGAGPRGVVVGDFNGDGWRDLAVANQNDDSIWILPGNGDGTFGLPGILPTSTGPRAIAAGDLNGDAVLDLVVANEGANTVSVFLGNGDGTFGARSDFLTGERPSAVVIADFDGDTRQDLAVANQGANSVSVFLGSGDGTFATRTDFNTGESPVALAARDVSGDNELDLVVANETGDTVTVLLGTGDGGFNLRGDFAVGDGPTSVTTGDFDGDGRIDVAAANRSSNSVTVILNRVTLVPSGEGAIAPYPAFQYEDLGLKVRATPRLHAEGEVTLQLQIELRSRSGETFNGIPVITNRSVEQTVRLRENETTLLSGMLQSEQQRGKSGWPGLGNLPIAGHVASQRTRQNRDTELLILVTPRRINLAQRRARLLYAGREPSTGGAVATIEPPE